MTQEHESSVIKPHKYTEKMMASERFETVFEFLKREGIESLSDLEKHILGRAVGMLLLKGEIVYSGLHLDAATDPPHDVRISDNEELDDVGQAMQGLEDKGFLKFDQDSQTYSLVTQAA